MKIHVEHHFSGIGAPIGPASWIVGTLSSIVHDICIPKFLDLDTNVGRPPRKDVSLIVCLCVDPDAHTKSHA